MRFIKAFFAFWYDFIVGDAWEVAAGVLASLVVLYLLVRVTNGEAATYGAYAFPVIILALLTYSLWKARDTA